MSNPLLRTKSIEQSIADTDEPGRRLRRNLSAWNLVVFGVSVVIGAGIFAVAAQMAGDKAGPAISLSFVMAAVACALAALCYAEFASTVPVAGSAYTFGYATFGEFLAWVLGWDLVLEFAVGSAVLAKAWSSYLDNVIGVSGTAAVSIGSSQLSVDWGALLVIAAMATLLAIGTRMSSLFTAVVTVIKVSVVLFFIVAGIFFIEKKNYTPFVPQSVPGDHEPGVDSTLFSLITGGGGSAYGWYGVLAAASIVFFAFIGFDVVATTAEETRNPSRDIPRGIIGSLVIVTVLYVAVSIVVTGMAPYKDLKTTVNPDGTKDHKTLADAFALHGADWAEKLVGIGALIGLTTVVMVLLLGQIRVLFAMSRDGLIPRSASVTSARFGTPLRLTVIVAVGVALLAAVFPMDRLEEMVNVGTLFAFVVVAAGVLALRRMRPDLKRGFTVPGGPVIPVLAIVACLWLMLNLTALTWIRFVAWMALGVVVYFAYSMRHSMVGRRERGELPAAGGD
ncbi:putative amino acid transporter [Gordonia araii NBRC 100433]|uniref:Putative amino acid transporter n=1 Tax=Gordonia araii NBRC 100433 TaxID=1073574 RepID=G7H285_9ACTN|nr:amino acid permease [Gordonia araii]NNG97499.1 amino acid permease [Gordonia araii NBRC 100433]GAB09960.1 putative amino acid transporter [Gordonia araii NBRC 100433]